VQVKTIYLSECYRGDNGLFDYIAVTYSVSKQIFIYNGLAPVCIDWNSKYNEVNGYQGKVNLFYCTRYT